MKRLLAILILFSAHCGAQSCTTATCNATDCTYANVLAAMPTSGNSNATVTVNIPACAATTWTSNLDIAVPSAITKLIIQGSGTPNTGSGTFGAGTIASTLTDNAGNSLPLLEFTAVYGQTIQLQNLNIIPNSGSTALMVPIWAIGTCTSSGCPNLRVDNMEFGNSSVQWTESGNGSNSISMLATDNFYGVMDHCTLPSGSNVHLVNSHHSAWLGVGQYGDNSWAQPDTMGTAAAFYAENNIDNTSTFSLDDTENAPGGTTANAGGGRYVARYNQIIVSGNANAGCYNHGTDSFGRPRGGRQLECYNNTLTFSVASQGTVGIRSGVLLSFNNVNIATGTTLNQYINLFAERRSANFSPWITGDGLGPYDTNDGTTYYSGTATGGNGSTTLTVSGTPWTANEWQNNGNPYSVVDTTQSCGTEIISNTSSTLTVLEISPNSSGCANFAPASGDSFEILRASVIVDQPGHGYGSYISGTTPSPTGSIAEVLDPVYEANDTTSSGSTLSDVVVNGGDISLIANRDYYAQASGIQTSATSPFNGTSGTGWGTLANRPTTCTTGVGYGETTAGLVTQIDFCNSTNTWSTTGSSPASYVPFTYPHPLDTTGGTGLDSIAGIVCSGCKVQ